MNKKILKLILVLCISLLSIYNICYAEVDGDGNEIIAPGGLSYAVDFDNVSKGLYFDGTDYYFVLDVGIPATDYMLNLHGKKYYFGDDGRMVRNEIIDFEGEKYFLDEEGLVKKNEWITREVTDEDGTVEKETFYFGPGGQAYRAKDTDIIIKNIDGQKYGFNNEGIRLEGYVKKDGTVLATDDSEDIENIIYYFDPEEDYAAASGMIQYSGEYPDGYDDAEELYLYFDPKTNRKVCSNTPGKYIARVDGGERYLFDYKGIRQKKWYATPSNTGIPKYYSEDYEGFLAKGWFIAVPHSQSIEAKNREYYASNEEQWYYAASDGKVVKDCIKKIGKYYYCFDRDGVMQEDCLVVVNNGKFVRSYKTDDLTYKQVVMGKADGGILDPGEKWLYFMYPENEEKEGAMCPFDKPIVIEISDESLTFLCNSRGGYGSDDPSNPIEKNNKYYQNGVLLKPNNSKYGVIQLDDAAGNPHYYVVNKSGAKLKKGCYKCDDKNYVFVGSDGEYRGTYDVKICSLGNDKRFKYKEDADADEKTCDENNMSEMSSLLVENADRYLNFTVWANKP